MTILRMPKINSISIYSQTGTRSNSGCFKASIIVVPIVHSQYTPNPISVKLNLGLEKLWKSFSRNILIDFVKSLFVPAQSIYVVIPRMGILPGALDANPLPSFLFVTLIPGEFSPY